MKLVVLDGYTLNPGDISWDELGALVEISLYDRTAPADVVERIGDAELVLTNKTPITREVMEQTNLRYIGVLATGYNVVDVEAAREKGILVTNIPTYGTNAVAQFTFALLLEACHHVGAHAQAVREGAWTASPDFCFWNYPLVELYGKTLGLIGFGKIGQAVGKIADAMGMNVIYFDDYAVNPPAYAKAMPLESLLKTADVISLHCPLFDSTKGIINAEHIAKMKDGVILINTSRGPLIEEEALAEALEKGKVAFAAVDVVSTEPIQAENPLLGCPNLMITPHIAWATKEARTRLMNIACDNVAAFLSGNPQNEVAK